MTQSAQQPLDSRRRLIFSLPISTFSALGVSHVMRYINATYLLTYPHTVEIHTTFESKLWLWLLLKTDTEVVTVICRQKQSGATTEVAWSIWTCAHHQLTTVQCISWPQSSASADHSPVHQLTTCPIEHCWSSTTLLHCFLSCCQAIVIQSVMCLRHGSIM